MGSAPATERAHRLRLLASSPTRASECAESVRIESFPSTPQRQNQDLADAQAIFDELEQQLASPETSESIAATIKLPNYLDNVPHGSSSSSSMLPASPAAQRNESLDTGVSEEAPHLLTFYRAKCLDLASQVQKRDTEVVQLRRALNEARCAGFVPESPTFSPASSGLGSLQPDANKGQSAEDKFAEQCARIDTIANLTNELRAAAGQLPMN